MTATNVGGGRLRCKGFTLDVAFVIHSFTVLGRQLERKEWTVVRLDSRRCALVFATALVMFVVAPSAWSEEISASVGQDGENQTDDVLIVQILLNQVPAESGGPEAMLVPDGAMGPKTVAAIEGFQRTHFGSDLVDGRVDPAGRTMKRLEEVVGVQSLDDRIVRVAKGERLFWQDGRRRETEEVVLTRLQKYWKAVRLDFTLEQLRDAKFQSDNPWSAAFVSWVVKTAGGDSQFRYSASHWQYVAAAKANRQAGNDNPFKAYRTNEQKVESADILVKRRGDSKATYDNIETGHITHGDIVVSVADGKAETIGGNVSNSVRTTMVELDDDREIAAEGYFAIVKVN
jgi:peptidoglycan hydrolase-like protein with peptidoglycan-binding domain